MRPIVSHFINNLLAPDLEARRKLSVTYLINTLPMEHMCAFRQLPQLLFSLIIFKANQAALARTYAYSIDVFRCYCNKSVPRTFYAIRSQS